MTDEKKMLKRNFDDLIRDLDGESIKTGASVEGLQAAINVIWPKLSPELQIEFQTAADKMMGEGLSLGKAAVACLLGVYEDEKTLDDSKRLARMELARKIHKGGIIDITPEERDLVKSLVTKRYAGILVPVVIKEMMETEAPMGVA